MIHKCLKTMLVLMSFSMSLIGFVPKPVTPYPVVGYREVSFFDDFHKVNRNLLIWYPVNPLLPGTNSKSDWDVFKVALEAPPIEAKKKMPLVVISHGYTGNPHQLSWLINGLVHRRFIVIGIQHLDLIHGKAHVNHWQRPMDVKMIIDQFSKDSLAEAADLNKIAIAGFSLGGTTSIWAIGGKAEKLDSLKPGPEYAAPEDFVRIEETLKTFKKDKMASDWRDKRVKAAFIMAPAWAWLFSEESLQKIKVPTYLIAAAEDKVLVTKNNAGFFARNIPHSIFQEIPGKGNHYIFISALNANQRKKVNPKGELNFLFEEDASIDRRWIQLQVVEEAARFFRSVFKE